MICVCGTCQTSRLLAQPHTAWALVVFLDHHAESERCFCLETSTAEMFTVLLVSVLGQVDVAVFQDKNMFTQRLQHYAQYFSLHVTTPALSVHLSRLRGMGDCSLNASQDIDMGAADLAPICESERVMDAVFAAVVASTRMTQALIARTDLPTYATLATYDSHSLKKMMAASCTLIISVEPCQIATLILASDRLFLSFAKACSAS